MRPAIEEQLPKDLLAALAPRFKLEGEIGRGGMGTVLLAHDRSLDRRVAIKVLPEDVSRALGPERFAREIRLTARLVHPNIVPLFDSGNVGDCLYYVMPFIDGATLRKRVEDGRLPPAEVVRIGRDLAEALAYAHALGVIHRDLKPDNVFWYGGRALLADFGIATTLDRRHDPNRTGTGTIVGTAAYMSPEQAAGSSTLDGRSDLYGLGCVMYELLSGEAPFTGGPLAVIAAHLTSAPAPLRDRCPDLDPALCEVVARLLAKSPDDRVPSAAALLSELAGVGPTSILAAEAAPAAPSPAAVCTTVPSAVRPQYERAVSLITCSLQGGEGAREKFDMARVYLERAMAKVPDCPQILIALADVIQVMGVRGISDLGAARAKAHELRMQALAIDDNVGEVHASLGVTFLFWDDDFETAGVELARGAALSPTFASGRRHYGVWLKIAGRRAEALEEMRAAVRLEPKAPFLHVGLGDVLMSLGRYGEAIGPLREALRLMPRYVAALERLEMSCHRAGLAQEAHDARRTLLGVRGSADRIAALDADVAAAGWVAARDRDLRRELEELLELAEREDPFVDRKGSRQIADSLVIAAAELGEWTLAMDWVERGYHKRPGRLRRVLTDLPYDYHGLAIDARFVRILRMAGLLDLVA